MIYWRKSEYDHYITPTSYVPRVCRRNVFEIMKSYSEANGNEYDPNDLYDWFPFKKFYSFEELKLWYSVQGIDVDSELIELPCCSFAI